MLDRPWRRRTPFPDRGSAASAFPRQTGRRKCRNARARPDRCERNWVMLDSSNHKLFGCARSANKSADHFWILDARRALHPGGNVDATGAGDPHGLRHIAVMKTAGDHERQREIEFLKHMPVEHRAEATRPGGLLGCASVKQNAV